jgi:hypothetical protein
MLLFTRIDVEDPYYLTCYETMLFKALKKYRFVNGEEDVRLKNLFESGYCVQKKSLFKNKNSTAIEDSKKQGEFFRL